ncbi:MAG: hypothetical protein DRI83_11130 [Bacteroidetes bacterium]|nr:MAG: hypothetical protein DRI83_11130 [Bacteroidota bacterium]
MPEASHVYSKTDGLEAPDPGGVEYLFIRDSSELQFTSMLIPFPFYLFLFPYSFSPIPIPLPLFLLQSY